jgi:multidrug resistance efflux pump
MKQPNRTPPLTSRAKAAKRRDRIAGVVLFLVAIAAVAVTAYAWWMRAHGG